MGCEAQLAEFRAQLPSKHLWGVARGQPLESMGVGGQRSVTARSETQRPLLGHLRGVVLGQPTNSSTMQLEKEGAQWPVEQRTPLWPTVGG